MTVATIRNLFLLLQKFCNWDNFWDLVKIGLNWAIQLGKKMSSKLCDNCWDNTSFQRVKVL
jgi:hypothetical protein